MKGIGVAQPECEKKINGFERWDVKQSMRTLAEAEKIKSDTKLMAAIGVLAKEEIENMASVLHHVSKATGEK